jgi:hypothetical protein
MPTQLVVACPAFIYRGEPMIRVRRRIRSRQLTWIYATSLGLGARSA